MSRTSTYFYIVGWPTELSTGLQKINMIEIAKKPKNSPSSILDHSRPHSADAYLSMRFNIPLTKNLWAVGRGPRGGPRAAGRQVGRRTAGREVDRGPWAADRGPWAADRGPPGRGPAFSKTPGHGRLF